MHFNYAGRGRHPGWCPRFLRLRLRRGVPHQPQRHRHPPQTPQRYRKRKAFNYSHLPHCLLLLLLLLLLLCCRFAFPVACWVGLSSPSLVAFAIQQQQQYTSARKYCKEKEKEKSISALDPPSQLLTGPSPSYRRTFTSFSPFFFPMMDARSVLLSSFGGLGN